MNSFFELEGFESEDGKKREHEQWKRAKIKHIIWNEIWEINTKTRVK